MGIWALYNPKLPMWPLIGLPVLAVDPRLRIIGFFFLQNKLKTNQKQTKVQD
jgi:hypothetical protein